MPFPEFRFRQSLTDPADIRIVRFVHGRPTGAVRHHEGIPAEMWTPESFEDGDALTEALGPAFAEYGNEDGEAAR